MRKFILGPKNKIAGYINFGSLKIPIIFSLILLSSFILPSNLNAALTRVYCIELTGGSAVSTTNTVVTFSFQPSSFYVRNTGSIRLWFDPTDGVAVAEDESTNIPVLAGEKEVINTGDPSASGNFTIGVITGSSTTDAIICGIHQ